MEKTVKLKKPVLSFVCECCKKEYSLKSFECGEEGWRYMLCSKCRRKIGSGRSSPTSGWCKYHACLIVRL